MTVAEIMTQIELVDGKVKSKSTGNLYEISAFIEQISVKAKLTKAQRKELEEKLLDTITSQSPRSKYIEKVVEKYDFKYSDGIYIVKGVARTRSDIYRMLWREEKLLPDETEIVLNNIEKISEHMDLQGEIFEHIKCKCTPGRSKYLASLYDIYPNVKWKQLFYNILVPDTEPLFHVFYDSGVGGTGKSTLLDLLIKVVGKKFCSAVLLDQFSNNFIFANMLGKYLNLGDDNGKNEELQNVGTLKSIITGNIVTIDRKHINPIEARIFAKQLFATNLFPYIDFTDGGIMRRLNVVEMSRVIPKTYPLCRIDDEEIGHFLHEVLIGGEDMKYGENNNSYAVTTSSIYRFYTSDIAEKKDYKSYKDFCYINGFRAMNIINFENKSKFLDAYRLKGKTGSDRIKQLGFIDVKENLILDVKSIDNIDMI